MSLTPEQRAIDRAIIDAATPGPWYDNGEGEWFDSAAWSKLGALPEGAIVPAEGCGSLGIVAANEDAAFIARARAGWPAALDALAVAEDHARALARTLAAEAMRGAARIDEIARLRAWLERIVNDEPGFVGRLKLAARDALAGKEPPR